MAQNIFIISYPLNNELVAQPYGANLYTNDQTIVWKILVDGVGWSPSQPGGPIQFGPGWTGSIPAPIGPPPVGLDQRLYMAQGPGPANGDAQSFTYKIYLTDGVRDPILVRRVTADDIVVDPDIWNQPQP